MDLQKYNVYPEYRLGQEEAIQEILNAFKAGSHVVELAAPTGAGKTNSLRAVGMVLLDTYQDIKKITYTSPLTGLVSQIANDTKLKLPVVMGRGNYPCPTFPGLMADDCPYRSKTMIKQRPPKCRRCEYNVAKATFNNSRFGVCTLDFYLYNRMSTDILIIDESSSLEDRLLDNFGISLPENIKLDTLEESILSWMEDLEEEGKAHEEALESVNLTSTRKTLLRQIQTITRRLNTIERTVSKCGRVLKIIKEQHEYFIDKNRNFKLIRGNYPFGLMSSKVQLVIMASGTPTTKLVCSDFTRVEAPHPIPVKNRKIYYSPVGKMSRNNQDATIPLMATAILDIHAGCPKSTIVHCHSYAIAKKLEQAMNHPMVLLQESGQRKEALQSFLDSKECIFLSVNYSEGLDLKGDQFQRNVIAKVPYPNLGDEWTIKRNEADIKKLGNDLWYRLATAVDIQQASGRCTRDPLDFSITYILDSNFGFFFRQNKSLFENWFVDALEVRK